jgi:TPR repeat protein
LGEAYGEGRGVSRDEAQAADWFRRAALRDHPGAARQLALIYAEGRGVDKDPDMAAVWSRIAARLADSTARNSK